MFRPFVFAILCATAVPAFAQNQVAPAPAQPAPPPPEIMNAVQTTASAFGGCVETGVRAVPAAVTPEAGAVTVLNGCATQRQALEAAVRRLITTLPAERQAAAQAQLQAQMGSVNEQIASGIRQSRAAPAPAPAPAPAQ
jgi:hypothetical protein